MDTEEIKDMVQKLAMRIKAKETILEVCLSPVDLSAIGKIFVSEILGIECVGSLSVQPGRVKVTYDDDPARDKDRIGWKTPYTKLFKLEER